MGSNSPAAPANFVVDIYPLSGYYFGSKEASPEKDETLFDRVQRFKLNFAINGTRTCVEGVLLVSASLQISFQCPQVELFRHPHVLLLQVRNSFFKLPGGRLRPGESDIDGLKRKLSSKLSAGENMSNSDWQIGECLGMWWRGDFETLPQPYVPPNVQMPKECRKLFLVKLPMNKRFDVPKNFKLLAVPLCQLHGSHKTYGPVISGIPQLLSKFSFNIVDR